jgi:hypothetical protein
VDPFIGTLSNNERDLFCRAFLAEYRDANFDISGRVTGRREKPMVVSTLRDAIGSVAATFRANDRNSPFHYEVGTTGRFTLRSSISGLLKAFGIRDPPTTRQKALTPAMLRDLQSLAARWGVVTRHTGDLIEGAYFFAMRACEFSKVRAVGKTRPLTLGNIKFRDRNGRTLDHDEEGLEDAAEFVTICFVDQKNGRRMDRRTQRRTGEAICPVRAWARVCKRVRITVPNASGETHAFRVGNVEGSTAVVDSDRVIQLLRLTCRIFGVRRGYGMTELEVGSRSIRSGAAMALFLMDHSVEKIMILGRWSSDAFMVYIRPQVLEWTNIMARDMAKAGSFHDLNSGGRQEPPHRDSGIIGDLKTFPRFYLGR